MSDLEIVRHQTQHLLDRVLKVFDKHVMAIPEGKLDFRTTPDNMSAKELSYHVYQVVHVLTRSTELGEYDEDYVAEIAFDPDRVTKPADIVAYGREVKDYVRGFLSQLTSSHLDRVLVEDWNMTGFSAMNLMYEEAIHHRGQLTVYLRLMGVKPGYLYDYNDPEPVVAVAPAGSQPAPPPSPGNHP